MLPTLVRTPRSEYLEACRRAGTRVNPGISAALPDTEAGFRASSLDFTLACIGRNGVGPLAAVVAAMPELRAVDVSDNYIGNDGAQLLCDALVGHTKLQVLRMAGNPISFPTGKRLERMIHAAPTLSHVDVSGTLMNPGLIKRVHQAAAAKSHAAAGLPDITPLRPADLSRARRADGSTDSYPTSAAVSTAASAPSQRDPSSTHNAASRGASGTPATGAAHKSPPTARQDVGPEERWYAMETIWAVAADAVPADAPADGSGFPGLLTVLAHVRASQHAA